MSEATTRAEEGAKEPGQIAYEARYVGVWRDVIAPWRDIGDGQRAAWVYVEKTIAARAESRAASAEASASALRDRVAVLESALEGIAACPRSYDDGTQSYNVTELFRMVKAIATAALNGANHA